MMMAKKGAISDADEKFLIENVERYTVAQFAKMLGRTENTIEKILDKHKLGKNVNVETVVNTGKTNSEDAQLLSILKGRPYYREILKQFNADEMAYFSTTWVNLMRQFNNDVLYSEEINIKQWITLEIQSNRALEEKRKCLDQIERLENELYKEQRKPDGIKDVDKMVQLESDIATIRSSMSVTTTEHSKLLERIRDISKGLKADRAERVKKFDDLKTSYNGFLKALEDARIRAKIGEEAEIHRMAKDKAIDKLSQLHKYADGQIDQPFLTPETLIDRSDDERQQ